MVDNRAESPNRTKDVATDGGREKHNGASFLPPSPCAHCGKPLPGLRNARMKVHPHCFAAWQYWRTTGKLHAKRSVGETTIPRDCRYCSLPIALPRRSRQTVHEGCAQGNNNEMHERWRKRHPSVAKAVRDAWASRLRREVLEAYGNECVCCGETTPEFLALDHIYGGGTAHRREIGKGHIASQHFYSWVRQRGYPKDLRILCHNCNQAKGKDRLCPHEIERGVRLDGTPIAALP